MFSASVAVCHTFHRETTRATSALWDFLCHIFLKSWLLLEIIQRKLKWFGVLKYKKTSVYGHSLLFLLYEIRTVLLLTMDLTMTKAIYELWTIRNLSQMDYWMTIMKMKTRKWLLKGSVWSFYCWVPFEIAGGCTWKTLGRHSVHWCTVQDKQDYNGTSVGGKYSFRVQHKIDSHH